LEQGEGVLVVASRPQAIVHRKDCTKWQSHKNSKADSIDDKYNQQQLHRCLSKKQNSLNNTSDTSQSIVIRIQHHQVKTFEHWPISGHDEKLRGVSWSSGRDGDDGCKSCAEDTRGLTVSDCVSGDELSRRSPNPVLGWGAAPVAFALMLSNLYILSKMLDRVATQHNKSQNVSNRRLQQGARYSNQYRVAAGDSFPHTWP
jgi:hypothetical protein